jgi:hypothetical protein
MSDIHIKRLHSLDGDYDDLGWYAKGHHDEKAFREALEESFWLTNAEGERERFKHPSEADETRCRFIQQWWINAFGRFRTATPKARGAFPVTALVTPEAEF